MKHKRKSTLRKGLDRPCASLGRFVEVDSSHLARQSRAATHGIKWDGEDNIFNGLFTLGRDAYADRAAAIANADHRPNLVDNN